MPIRIFTFSPRMLYLFAYDKLIFSDQFMKKLWIAGLQCYLLMAFLLLCGCHASGAASDAPSSGPTPGPSSNPAATLGQNSYLGSSNLG